MWNWIAKILIIMALIVGALLLRTFYHAGSFRKAESSFNGVCKSIELEQNGGPAIIGVEDIVIDHERGVAYLSSVDRRGLIGTRGAIYLLPLNSDTAPETLRDITQGEPALFSPHGIDLYINAAGERRIFAVNHREHPEAEVSSITIYKMSETGLLDVEADIVDEKIYRPNDVAAVSETEFYVTNDLMSDWNSLDQTLDLFAVRNSGNLVHYKNGDTQIVAGPYAMPNGVSYNPSSDQIFVAETLKGRILGFSRNADGTLQSIGKVNANTAVDNFAISEKGDLYTGAHINILQFAGHRADEEKASAGNVVRLEIDEAGNVMSSPVQAVLTTKGETGEFGADGRLSGISVAAAHKNIMLIGSVFEPRIWRCEMAS